MKSGNLNFLEPSGPVQAFNGTDLPLISRINQHVCGYMKSLVIFCSISDTLPLGNVVSSICQKSLMSKHSTVFKWTPTPCVQNDPPPLKTFNFQEKTHKYRVYGLWILCVLDRASSWYLNKGWPTRWHLLYYIFLNMFHALIRPSSGASEYLLCCVGWLEACWCYVAGLSVGDVVSECWLNLQ